MLRSVVGFASGPLFAAAMLLLGAMPVAAATLNGRVIDNERREPVAHAVVYVGEVPRAETDTYGGFRLTDLPAGEAVLRVEHVGFDGWSRNIVLNDRRPVEITIRLKSRVQTLETVEVDARRPDPSVPQGKETITPMQIRKAAGTIATDPLRAVQSLPGAAAAGDDFSDQYVVRGGDPEENALTYDDYLVLRPVHLEGFTSIIYDDLIGGVDFYPGALPPRYGDALSSLTSLGPARAGEKTVRFFRYDLGSIALGGQGARGAFEGIGAVRSSFYNLIIRRPPGVDRRSFRDLTGKGTWRSGSVETSVTAIGSRDREHGDVTRSVDQYMVGIRTGSAGQQPLEWRVSASLTESDGRASYFRSNSEPRDESRADFRRAAAGIGIVLHRGPYLLARIDAEGRQDRFIDLTAPHTDAAGFGSIEGTWSGPLVAVSTGARVEKIAFTRGTPVSPYVSFRFRRLGRFVPGIAWRTVRQSPFSLIDAPEVAGLPVDPETLFRAGADRLSPVRADHVSGTCDITVTPGLLGGIEIYRKRYSRLLTWPADDPAAISGGGSGYGNGASLSLRREGRGVRGSVSYTVSRTRKREGPATDETASDYDQPMMIQAAVEIPIHGGTGMSLGYRASSGRPYTPLEVVSNAIVPGEVNSERLPYYARLDVKLEHRVIAAKTSAFFYLDVLNLTSHRNIVDIVQYKGGGGRIVRIPTYGVRILPIAGFGFYF